MVTKLAKYLAGFFFFKNTLPDASYTHTPALYEQIQHVPKLKSVFQTPLAFSEPGKH